MKKIIGWIVLIPFLPAAVVIVGIGVVFMWLTEAVRDALEGR